MSGGNNLGRRGAGLRRAGGWEGYGWGMAVWICLVVGVGAEEVRVRVSAGGSDRVGTPVTAGFSEGWEKGWREPLRLRPVGGGEPVAAQVLEGEEPELAWVLEGRLGKGEAREYVLERGEAGAGEGMRCEDGGGHLRVLAGGREVLAYAHEEVKPPEGVDPVFARSGFIHPLVTPAGRVVTDDFPGDHLHQHGIFVAWPRVEVGGRKVDLWNQAEKTGSIRHAEVEASGSGPACAWFRVRLRYRDLTVPGGGVDIADDRWTVRVWNTPGRPLVDLASEVACITGEALVFPRYHYGGMAVRGAADWFVEKGERRFSFLTSGEKTAADGNHTEARWVDHHGEFKDGGRGGVVVVGHPSNFRYPQMVRLHPDKPYFCYAPMVGGGFEVKPGERFRSSYRLFAYDGEEDAGENRRVDVDFADPPKVEVEYGGEGSVSR